MEREVGGGIGMGNTCKPMADSFQCMTKFTTKKKKMCTFETLILKVILLLFGEENISYLVLIIRIPLIWYYIFP